MTSTPQTGASQSGDAQAPASQTGDYRLILERILQAVDGRAYLTPTHHIPAPQQAAAAAFGAAMRAGDMEPEAVRALVQRLYQEGRFDKVLYFSALHIVAAHPRVKDWPEAARLVGEQEVAVLEKGGADLAANLASVDRHRGVLAFLMGHHAVALDYFSRALERQHNPENFGNVLCALLRLGQEEQALDLLDRVCAAFPQPFVAELERRISDDPDLALLRPEETLS